MLRPKRSLGQNFLINPHILDKIISAAEISKEDIILEVGPGTGLLTKKLAEKAGKVLAVEKDHRLIPVLQENFKNYPNVKIIEGDILGIRITLAIQGLSLYKIVANIPYYITSNFLRKILEEWPKPKLIVLTIQKEVAQRIVAKPPRMNLLALSVQYFAEPKIIGYVSKNSFRPVPKMDSAIIRLNPKSEIPNPKQTEEIFKLIKVGFSGKRKQLAGNLLNKLNIPKENTLRAFEKLGLKSAVRAENLSLNQWQKLSELFR